MFQKAPFPVGDFPPTIEHGFGNREVIALLKQVMADAEQGKLGFLIIGGSYGDGGKMGGYCGATMLQKKAVDSLNEVMANMKAEVESLTPVRDESLGYDYACFNVPYSPLCYDFAPWLVDREMLRVRMNAPAPLKVGFFCGRDNNRGLAETPDRLIMFHRVVRPMLKMIGAVEDPKAIGGSVSECFVSRNIVEAFKRGEKVPRLRPSKERLSAVATWSAQQFGARQPVVMTLRETDSWPDRNSNTEDWIRFARFLQARGEAVIFVRDTNKAHEPLEDFVTCPQASINLDTRFALYNFAKVNFIGSNGPTGLLLFSDCPWYQFVEIHPDGHNFPGNTPKFWREGQGVVVGNQYPWTRPDQRIIWGKDIYDNMLHAWARFVDVNKAAA